MTEQIPRVKYVGTSRGRYEVRLPDGTLLGEVQQKVEHYNLRRSVTVKWWQVEGVGDFNVGALYRNGMHRFDTRTKAVQQILAYLDLEKEYRP